MPDEILVKRRSIENGQGGGGGQIFQLVLLEAKLAKMIDLRVDLLHHFLGEDDALVSALEIIFPAKIGVLMEDHLIHIELIEVE